MTAHLILGNKDRGNGKYYNDSNDPNWTVVSIDRGVSDDSVGLIYSQLRNIICNTVYVAQNTCLA